MLSKTNGQVVGDLMTPAPVVVSETTNLEDVARFCFPALLFRVSASYYRSTWKGLIFVI